MATFGGKKNSLNSNLANNSFCFKVLVNNTAEVENIHFQTSLDKVCVFFIFKGLNEKISGYISYEKVTLNILRRLTYFVCKQNSNCS